MCGSAPLSASPTPLARCPGTSPQWPRILLARRVLFALAAGGSTLPVFELRRALHEALASPAPFAVTYALLDGHVGDEAWRRTSTARRVRVRRKRGGGRVTCEVEARAAAGPFSLSSWRSCDAIEELPPPSPLLAKLIVLEAYPILPGEWSEVHCYGP